MKFHFFCNPSAGRWTGDAPARLRSLLKGHQTLFFISSAKGDIERAVASVAEGWIPVVVGGDGTVNEAVNGLRLAGRRISLGLIPAGTVNVLARELEIPDRLDDAAAILPRNRIRVIDAGLLTSKDSSRSFFLMAGFGFDAQAVRNADMRLKRLAGPFAYLISGLAAAFSPAPGSFRLRFGGAEALCTSAVIQNCSYYGGSLKLDRSADPADGQLNCVILSRSRGAVLLSSVFSLVSGVRFSKNVSFGQSAVFSAQLPGPVPVQLDGDYYAELEGEVEISIVRSALEFLA